MKSNRVLVKLAGPFLSKQAEIKLDQNGYEKADKMIVWFEGKNNLDDVSICIVKRALSFPPSKKLGVEEYRNIAKKLKKWYN